MSALITLTTDFGLTDHYVGTMKGVILSRSPEARIIDISHGVAPFSIWEGAYTIAQAAPFFPPGTIHVVVVDPGVGTDRKAILAESQGQLFIAPDNGVLSFLLPGATVRELTNQSLFLNAVSSTFHGRDVFAAAAASLSAGVSVGTVGPVLPDPVHLDPLKPVSANDGRWCGRVLSVDRFGNIVTNLPVSEFPQAAIETNRGIINRQYRTFAQGRRHEIFLYAGSSGFVEIAINQGDASQALGLRPGDLIRFRC